MTTEEKVHNLRSQTTTSRPSVAAMLLLRVFRNPSRNWAPTTRSESFKRPGTKVGHAASEKLCRSGFEKKDSEERNAMKDESQRCRAVDLGVDFCE